jgi:putative ABC transport system permease protein
LGASVQGIVILLAKDFIGLVAIAILIASPIAWYLMDNWLQGFAYRISINWFVFAVAGVMSLGIAFLTIALRAAKAALSNPVHALRSE